MRPNGSVLIAVLKEAKRIHGDPSSWDHAVVTAWVKRRMSELAPGTELAGATPGHLFDAKERAAGRDE